MNRLFLSSALISSLLVFSQNAFAAPRAYRASTLSNFSETASQFKIIDQIPQLGILVSEQDLSSQRGLQDLGEVGEIQLVQPYRGEYKKLWGLKAIEASTAWTLSQGEGVTVAVSDTGIDSAHSELRENLWTNLDEVEGNGIDDDNNGYIDDIHGWNFVTNRPSKRDNHYHGTHVAGTIAAREGVKISGVAPRAKLMDVAFISGSGSGSEVNAAKSIVYAVDNGAKLINCSWGGEGKDAVIQAAIDYAEKKGVLVVAAAGNYKKNIDRHFFSPASSTNENVISVAATSNKIGYKADYSNVGSVSVDLAAPGSNILSTAPNGRYQSLSGTSMATPHVSGVIALILGQNPNLTSKQVKAKLLSSVVPMKNWKKNCVTGGVANARAAVN